MSPEDISEEVHKVHSMSWAQRLKRVFGIDSVQIKVWGWIPLMGGTATGDRSVEWRSCRGVLHLPPP